MPANAPPTVQVLLQQAHRAMQKGDRRSARHLVHQAIAIDPEREVYTVPKAFVPNLLETVRARYPPGGIISQEEVALVARGSIPPGIHVVGVYEAYTDQRTAAGTLEVVGEPAPPEGGRHGSPLDVVPTATWAHLPLVLHESPADTCQSLGLPGERRDIGLGSIIDIGVISTVLPRTQWLHQ